MVLGLLIVALRPTGGGCKSLRDQLRETGAQHRANFREIQTPREGQGGSAPTFQTLKRAGAVPNDRGEGCPLPGIPFS